MTEHVVVVTQTPTPDWFAPHAPAMAYQLARGPGRRPFCSAGTGGPTGVAYKGKLGLLNCCQNLQRSITVRGARIPWIGPISEAAKLPLAPQSSGQSGETSCMQ